MQVNLSIDSTTTKYQLRAISRFVSDLAGDQSPQLAVPADPAELSDPEPVVIKDSNPEQPQTTTRRRRTKAEIAADEAAAKPKAEAEAKAQEDAISGAAHISTDPCFWEDVVGNFGIAEDGVLPNAEAFVIDEARYNQLLLQASSKAVKGESTKVAEPVDDFEKVAAGGKTYTEAEVQALAANVARTKGADVVKGKIAELGGARIAALSPEQLNSLGAFLEGLK